MEKNEQQEKIGSKYIIKEKIAFGGQANIFLVEDKDTKIEFSASPKKPLEIIKEEEEELKFKKESSNIELFNENKFNNVEKDSEPVKEKSNNINKLINENEQNNKKINEDNVSNINEEKNENENENFVENDNKENKKIENPNNIENI